MNIFRIIIVILCMQSQLLYSSTDIDIGSEINKVVDDGLSFDLNYTTENKWGNTLSSAYLMQGVGRYKEGVHTGIVVAEVDSEQQGTETFAQNSFLQFLYRYDISNVIDIEANISDYRNEFRGFSKRQSVAVGPRMKVVANKETEVFASARIMYETQHLLDENRYPGQSDFQNSVRLSLFLSATYKLLDFVKFSGNIVLQPKVDDPGDIRMIPTGG